MIKLALGIICKGDSEFDGLVRAVASVSEYVDDVFITTSEKEDSKVKMYCQHYKYHYSHRDWTDDFSAQRNFNFKEIEKHDTYDYILWFDCDDIFVGGANLRQVATNAKTNHIDIVFFTYWYACTFKGEPSVENFQGVQLEHMRERLLRPGTNVWKSRLHETPVPVTGYEIKYSKYPYDSKERPISVMHTTLDTDELNGKMMRNKRILEIQLKEERQDGEADPRTILYLMKIYSEIGTPELCKESIKMGDEYLRKSGWDQERGICYEQMGIAYGKMGDDLNACKMLHQAIAEHPGQVLFYTRLAQAYYNLGKYKQCEHWLKVGASLEIVNDGNDQINLKAMKIMYSELLLNLNWKIHKDTKKALDAAYMLYQENPTPENKENLLYIGDADALNDTCERIDKVSEYLHSVNMDQHIVPMLDSLPLAVIQQPFAIKLRQRYSAPRKWGRNEICYFANFGGPFLEQWDSSSLSHGMGGSETAVIELSKEWSKLGYKVTVYADPDKPKVDEFGITWLPWYYFNRLDFFNIFIQWRNWETAGHIKCHKFFVDLHDIVANTALRDEQSQNIDKVFFKSKAHRALLTKLPQEKVKIISNGVRL